MRILLLTHAFNSLTQRIDAELRALGHVVSIEFDIADSVTEEAVALFAPDVLIAPYLRRAIPEAVWSRLPCLVVHPGVVGDRGPSALDWAITLQESTWGVTVLRPGHLEKSSGIGAWPWLGRQVLPIKTWGPGLIDFHWQLPGLEFWLKKNGIPDLSPNLERQPMLSSPGRPPAADRQ